MIQKIGELDMEKSRQRAKKGDCCLKQPFQIKFNSILLRDSTKSKASIYRKTYINTVTSYGDKIEDIPRANFFVSEDNYAWIMEELVVALVVQNGVMSNPWSKLMF
jgi:hypothetical protein